MGTNKKEHNAPADFQRVGNLRVRVGGLLIDGEGAFAAVHAGPLLLCCLTSNCCMGTMRVQTLLEACFFLLGGWWCCQWTAL